MDGPRFDAFTRFVATPRTRRQVAQALGGGLVAIFGGLAGAGRAEAACPSGVVCGGACCGDASDLCLRDRCTSCPSGVICRDRCCADGQQCIDGRCTGCASGITCGDQCCDAGESCTNGRCQTTHPAPQPTPNSSQNPSSPPCPPGHRECDGVCYPGGCCTDADCGDPCLLCGTDHTCHGCPPGQTCQGGGCAPVCTPACAGKGCGDDGCGGSCGTCPSPQVCQQGSCCTPATCQKGQCGSHPDGCGGTVACGDCPAGQSCQNGTCVAACKPTTCEATGADCGTIPDGCGGTLECGGCDASKCQTCDAASNLCFSTCTSDQTCCDGACKVKQGGTGCHSDADCCGQVCNAGTCCTPLTACPPGYACGTILDGCGGTLKCGDCKPKCEYCSQHTCVSVCPTNGAFRCIEGQCCKQNDCPTGVCGTIDDGCGGTRECGCPTGQQCHNGRCCIPGQTGSCCTPYICQHFGDDSDCGKRSDGCGNTIDCGDCPSGEVCFGGICCIPDCRSGPCIDDACGGICPCSTGQICYQGTCCTPATCDPGRCGTFDDGCGNTLHCGSCDAGKCETCGADHICHGCDSCSICNEERSCFSKCENGQICDQGNCCTPVTCASKGVSCGSTDNGCGGTLDCGDCASGQVCLHGSCCTKTTCAAQGTTCGTISDGCGGNLDCGTCASGQLCVNYGCFKTTSPDCAKCCPPGQFCPGCSCTNGFDGTTHHLCVGNNDTEIRCFGGNADCPHGQACFTPGNPPICLPPC